MKQFARESIVAIYSTLWNTACVSLSEELKALSTIKTVVFVIMAQAMTLANATDPDPYGKACMDRALRFEIQADRTHSPKLYGLALDNYLCASKKGHPVASARAASLSLSGQAPQLPPEEIKRLLLQAAEMDIPGAHEGLADLYCGDEYYKGGDCANISEAMRWLTRAAALGSRSALNSIGAFYERGQLGAVDLKRARACFQSAAWQGLEVAKNNLKRVEKKLQETNLRDDIYCFDWN